MKINFYKFSLLISLLYSSLVFTACSDEPSDVEKIKLIQNLWLKDYPSSFLKPNDNIEEYYKLGFKYSLLPAMLSVDTVIIKKIEIIDKKEAKKSGDNEKEIKMIIKINGAIKTYNVQTDRVPLYEPMGYENFIVTHTYYFIKNKFGEWNVESDHKIVK